MKKFKILSILLILVSVPAYAGKPDGSVYLDGGNSKTGLILAHGKGKHPTWLVVDPLRKGVHEKLGYHTLSLQMPTGHSSWLDYADDFPESYDIIKKAIRFLMEEKHVSRVFLMGHSMGSRMASSFVSENPSQPVSGLIVVGCRNNGGYPLSCEENLQGVGLPILDIWGEYNGKDYNAARERSNLVSVSYQQVEISGANHKLEGYENEFVTSVVEWLKTQ
jgi:predicted esterase